MLDYGILRHNGPFAIRYPRGTGKEMLAQPVGIKPGKGVRILEGKDVTITAVGMMTETALKAAELLSGKGILAEVINARFVKPLDEQLILDSVSKTGALVTLEDNCIRGGFGSSILELIIEKGLMVKTKLFGFPDEPIPHGSRKELYKKYGLDPESIANETAEFLKSK